MEIIKHLKINYDSILPKHRLIVNIITENIEDENLRNGEKLPSIAHLIDELKITRYTAVKAYEELKSKKLICSTSSKGYYVSGSNKIAKINILFLINKLGSYEMEIYNGFVNSLSSDLYTNLQIYNFNEDRFVEILRGNLKAYDFYVIIPHFKSDQSKYKKCSHKIRSILNKIPSKKLFLLDNKIILGRKNLQILFQDFKKNIYSFLYDVNQKLKKYDQIILVNSIQSIYPKPIDIYNGFINYCIDFGFKYEIVENAVEDIVLKKNDLFLVLEDDDLISLVHQIRKYKLVLGKDLGIIAYNDSPLRDLLEISVISTDYLTIGKMASEMILSKDNIIKEMPFNITIRDSF